MYCVMNFFVFVCSSCAGIHRELNHKVKGISMSVFTEQELKDLGENGNAVSKQQDASLFASSFTNLCLCTFIFPSEPARQTDEKVESQE